MFGGTYAQSLPSRLSSARSSTASAWATVGARPALAIAGGSIVTKRDILRISGVVACATIVVAPGLGIGSSRPS